jgi:hypothetical protein
VRLCGIFLAESGIEKLFTKKTEVQRTKNVLFYGGLLLIHKKMPEGYENGFLVACDNDLIIPRF